MTTTNLTNPIIQLDQPAVVSMADSWFEHGTPDHFWVKHRNAVFDRHFKTIVRSAAQVGEVGCGSGLILSHLANTYQKAADGFELNLHALKLCPKLPGNLYIYDIFQRHPDLVDRYDLLMMMDVLEHIEDEVSFLQAVQDHLKPGGFLILGVPMRQHLYSTYDKADGHFRRYSAKYLQSVVEKAGLSVQKTVQWGHAYLPVLLLRQQMLKNVSGDAAIKQGFAISPIGNQVMSLLRYFDVVPTFGMTGASSLLLARKK
jgi:2-polyprenyl-3-methyl-5-hydroxy-6-metoxy-1,4-benzoquinol methylase